MDKFIYFFKQLKMDNFSYDYSELFDENKTYTTDQFTADFGKGLLNYEYSTMTLNLNNTPTKYVVVLRVPLDLHLKKSEIVELIPFCQCKYHKSKWYNPLKWLTYKHIPITNGCLENFHITKSDLFVSRAVIERSIKFRNQIDAKK